MVRLVVMVIVSSLSSFSSVAAFAAPAASTEVVAGRDLTAWQILEQRRLSGVTAVDAYRSFILLYNDSPFAIAAYGRLVELGGVEGTWTDDPAVKAVVNVVRREYTENQRILADSSSGTRRPIVSIDLSDGFAGTQP